MVKTKFYKFILFLLVFVFTFQCFGVPASAVAVVDDIALVALAVLAACGMSFVFSGLDKEGAVQHVKDLLENYRSGIGDTSNWLTQGALSMYGGKLRLAAQLASKLYSFANWLKNHYSITNNSNTNIISISAANGFQLADGTYLNVGVAPGSTFRSEPGDMPNYFPLNDSRIILFENNSSIDYMDTMVTVYTASGIKYFEISKSGWVGFSLLFYNDILHLFFYSGSLWFLGSSDQYALQDVFGDLVQSAAESVEIDAGVIDIPVDIPVGSDVLVDVIELPGVLPLTDALDFVGDAAIDGTLEAEQEIVEDLPPVVTNLEGDYTIDLTGFFPFCIPFDIYDAVTMLNASPEAPVFKLEFEWLNQDYGFEVDLSSWDNVAAVARKMEVLAFVVALGAATRKFIKW